TVTVEDAKGNLLANTAVTLSASGADNSFGSISGVTNAEGVFTTTLASTLAQTETITASEGSVQEATSVTFAAAGTPVVKSITASGPGIVHGNGDLNAGKTVILTVDFSAPVFVKGTPYLSLNDGGKAVYTGGSGTDILTFAYIVAAGQNTADLSVTGLTGSIVSSAGNKIVVSSAAGTLSGTLEIDTKPPRVIGVSASAHGRITTGQLLAITLDVSEPVTVAGTPELLLNDGGTAIYNAAQSTSKTLVFDYKVASNQITSDLSVSGFALSSTSAITDLAGNVADLSAADVNLGLQVNPGLHQQPGPGSFTISGSSDLELFGSSQDQVTFAPGASGLLKLDDSRGFAGTIAGFARGDTIDLADLAFGAHATLGYSQHGVGGTLTVSNGSQTAKIQLLGNYMAASFVASADGHGGTVITETEQNHPPLVTPPKPV
ncbi:MAG: Ig-like domain-containing protein, partial [Acetobacteraceae bacterium]